MKKIITLFTFLLAASFGVFAQTNNLNEYNLKVYFNQGVGVVDNDQGTWGASRYHIRAGNYESSSSPTHLLNTNVGADNGVREYGYNNNQYGTATGYGYNNNENSPDSYVGPVVYYPILPNGSNSLTTTQSNTTGKFNVSVMSYAWDSGLAYIYERESDGNMGFLNQTVSFAPNQYPNNEILNVGRIDNAADGTINRIGFYEGYGSDSFYYVKYSFRPKHGRKNDPLNFGTLVSGAADIWHTNSNKSSPNSTYYNSTDIGYSNDWDGNGFYPGNDITYQFTITKEQTVKWTIYKTTSDSQKFLVSRLMDANNVAIYGSFQSSAIQDHSKVLCAGTYTLVLDGYGNSNTSASSFHDFDISITATDYRPNPGIVNVTGTFREKNICPSTAFDQISSVEAASTLCGGPISYQWQKKTGAGDWSNVSGATSVALTQADSSSSNIGSNTETVRFRRMATGVNGAPNYSNEFIFYVYPNDAIAGSIGADHTVPYPREINTDILQSVSVGSATNFTTYSWEQETSGSFSAIPNANSASYTLPELTETTTFKRKVETTCNTVFAYSNEVTVTVLNPPNGLITGRVVPPGADFDGTRGVSGVTITAVRTTPVLNGASNKTYTTTTGSDGFYTIPGVYYGPPVSGSQATFVITPSKGDHVFSLSAITRILSTITPTTDQQKANFEDLTVFTISGKTTQICTNCDDATTGSPIYAAMDSVSFEVNRTTPPIAITPTTSKSLANGTYSFDVDQQGTYRVKPTYKKSGFNDHVFVEKVRKVKSDSLVVIGEELDTPNVDFVNTTTHTITGYLKAGCGQYVGQANIRFQQILDVAANGAVTYGTELIKTVTTNLNSGDYSVTLPAARYKATVVGFETVATGINGNEMVDFFGVNKFFPLDSVSRDITWGDATLNFTFREFPEIAVEYEAECNDLADFPIFYQNKYKEFTIKAYEGSPTKVVPGQATLGCLMMDNDTILTAETSVQLTNLPSESDVNEIFKYEIEGGIHLDSLKGGFPNITNPFTKVLTIKLKDPYERTRPINSNPSQSAIKVLTPIIIGVIPSAGTFNTVSPEIPLLILRDPPGDGSYSFFEQNKTTETANRFFAADGVSSNAWAKVKVGGKISLGLGAQIETEAWGEVGTDFGVSNTSTSSEEAILSISNTTEYSTNDSNIDDGLTKGSGDLYIGAAVNLLYAVIRETIYDKDSCKVKFKKSMMLSGDGFATTYMYTEDYILNGVIPDLEETIVLGEITPEEQADLRNQINVWQQTVSRNTELKANAIFDQNLSFNGGGVGFKRYSSSSSSQSSTIEFNMEINAGVSAELGLEVGGVGASGGVTANFKMETGAAETVTQLSSTTTGFFLQDDDAGDAFTIDVKNDPVYNTPVFDLVAGKSSCPFEFGTQPRDEFSFTTANSELSGIPTGTQADFIVNIANTSQTTEARTYNIQYTNSTTGAAVNVGSALANNYFTNLTAPQTLGDNRDVLVSVTQQSPSFRIFTPITLRAFDDCDAGTGNLEKFLQLKAFYVGACSNISLQSPQNGQVVSAASNNRLNLDIRDYTFASITEVTLQYAQEGTTNWNTAVTWPTLANNAAGDGSKFWTIPASVADGNYKVRMQLKCATETVYSSDVSIIIDRNPPVPFGLPEPTDRVLVLGDQISATYTDDLGCANISGNNFTITRLSNNTAIPAIIGCRDNKVFITPTVDILGWVGDSVRVTLTNIPDMYGNIQTTPNQWKFNIGTAPEVSPSLPVATVSTSSPNAIREDASGFINVIFTLSQTFTENTTINFLIAGDAQYSSDFTGVDTRTALGFESSLQTGQIIIPANNFSASTKLYPINDSDFEDDETVFLSLISGGNYSIGTNNNVTITILKDDDVDNTDDCFNGGLPFTLTNNNGGATGLTDGSYHKLILESTAKVRIATTVVLKGEKSITLQPGFEIESGSVFSAIMEDCPEGTLFAPASLTANKGEEFTLPSSFGIYPKDKGSKILAVQDVDKDGNIKITFESPQDQQYLIRLNSFRAAMVQNLTTDKVYTIGTHEITVNVADLKAGTYFLKMKGMSDDVTTYHRIVIAD